MLQERTITLDGSGDNWAELESGLVVPTYAAEPVLPIAVDLFAGAGGFSLGMHQGGFHVAGALEWSVTAAATYLCNLGGPETLIHVGKTAAPDARKADKRIHDEWGGQTVRAGDVFEKAGTGWIRHAGCTVEECTALIEFEGKPAYDGPGPGMHAGIGFDGEYNEYLAEINAPPAHGEPCEHLWLCDARDLTGEALLEALGVDEIDCVFGGPPCQGFSHAGRRNVVDPRNSLVFEFVRLVLETRAKTMVMENVPGMVSMTTPEGIPVVDALTKVLTDGGFGEYDALRSSLLKTAGLKPGAAIRGSKKTKRAGSDDVDEEPEDDAPPEAQEALF